MNKQQMAQTIHVLKDENERMNDLLMQWAMNAHISGKCNTDPVISAIYEDTWKLLGSKK